MAKQTFDEVWLPDTNHSCATKPRVQSVKFGDGYELRMPTGINNIIETWNLTFTVSGDVADDILAFLVSHGGSKSFLWKTPNEETKTFICREWSANRDRGIKKVSASFEQVFEF